MYLHVTENMRIRECPQYRKGFCRLGAFARPVLAVHQLTCTYRTRMPTEARPPCHVPRLPRRVLRQGPHMPLRPVRPPFPLLCDS